MTKDEELAMDLALEALELSSVTVDSFGVQRKMQEAITAIKQALAAPTVQEPVAWMRITDITELTDSEPEEDGYTPLYTTPPAAQRQWVGLTDEEIRKWWSIENGLEDCKLSKLDDFTLAVRAIEAKLKEKNT
jgi:hypothetical protein